MEDILILERGLWKPEDVVVHQLATRDQLKMYPPAMTQAEDKWNALVHRCRIKGSRIPTGGPTIRLAGRYHLGDQLVLEVLPSNYREGGVVSFLGVGMVLVTNDNYIVLQRPIFSSSQTIGGGVRVPGCTPETPDVFNSIVAEVKEEFNLEIAPETIEVIGVLEVRPPAAVLHHVLVTYIILPVGRDEVLQAWQSAPDQWEGELQFESMNRDILHMGTITEYNVQSRMIINCALEHCAQ